MKKKKYMLVYFSLIVRKQPLLLM